MPPSEDPGWNALCAFLRRPWFTRLWVVQEVVSNDKVLVMWGDCSCPWDLFQRCLLSIFDWDNIHAQGCDDPRRWQATAYGWTSLHRIQVLKRRPINKKGFLLGLLYHLRMFKASSPRDNLFAVLGLAEDGQSHHFKPDYTEPIASILLRYATNYVKSSGGFHLLRYASWGAHCETFPSWIPDWVTHQSTIPIPLAWEFNGEQDSPLKYHAAGNTAGRIGFIRGAPPGLLSLKGRVVDTIAAVGVPYHLLHPPMPDGDHNDAGKAACFASAEQLLTQLSTYPTGEEPDEVLFRTLIANSSDDATLEHGPGNITRQSFFAFRKYHRNHHRHHHQQQQQQHPHPPAHKPQSSSAPPSPPFTAAPQPTSSTTATLKEYDGQFVIRLRNRVPALTKTGYFGIIPDSARAGDVVAIFLGCPLPFILRESEVGEFKACASGMGASTGDEVRGGGDGDGDVKGEGSGGAGEGGEKWDEDSIKGKLFRVIGHAYVHGMMKGEMVPRGACGVVEAAKEKEEGEWAEWLHLH